MNEIRLEPLFEAELYQDVWYAIEAIEDEGFLRFKCTFYDEDRDEVLGTHLLWAVTYLEEVVRHCERTINLKDYDFDETKKDDNLYL